MESCEIHSERVCRIRISRPSTLFEELEIVIEIRELCSSQRISLMPFAQLHFHKAHSPIPVLFALTVIHSACAHIELDARTYHSVDSTALRTYLVCDLINSEIDSFETVHRFRR